MKAKLLGVGLMATLITCLTACGGSDGGGPAPATGGSTASGAVAAAAAKDPAASNTAKNPNAAFSLVIDAGLAPVTVSSPPVVTFAVIDSSGKPVPGLTLFNAGGASADPACSGGNVKFAIAQLQADDNWRSLISNKQNILLTGSSAKTDVIYAALDPVETATIKNPSTIDATHPQLVGILTENASSGYYTYKAAVDVSSATYSSTANAAAGTTVLTNGLAVVKDGKTVHRAALLLCYIDPATKATVKVNPYIDFTVGSDGKALALKDSAGKLTEAKKVVDRAACNGCHQNFAAHGGGRNEPQVCVMCHNPGSRDFHNDGQPVDFKLMVHKFHRGKLLTQDYMAHNSVARKTDPVTKTVYGVTYPGEIRNCAKCHDGSATATVKTAQGDNWKSRPSKNACLACHDNYKVAGSGWQVAHIGAGLSLSDPDSNPDSTCVNCHGPSTSFVNAAAVHVVPEWTMGESYQYNIWKTTLNADRTVTVEYSVSNPKDGSDYDLADFAKYSYVLTNTAGTLKTKTFVFGSGAIYIGWGTDDYANTGAIGRPWQSACITSGTPTSASTTACSAAGLPQANNPQALSTTALVTNGYNGALITRGQPVALNPLFDPTVKRIGTSNRFTITSTPIPASTTGSGVVAYAGRVNLQKDANTSYGIPVKNVVSYFSLDGKAVQPRRDVVSTAKCEACHDKFIRNHGHGGSRNTPEVCVICHTGNTPLNGAIVAGGAVTQYAESAHFKRFIHMVHEEQTVNNKVNATLLGQGNNFPAQNLRTAAYGATSLSNCNMCHGNNSYQKDLGVTGTSVTYDVDLSKATTSATITDTDPSNNKVISPKASACSSCHDTDDAKAHMVNVGGAVFGTATQADLAAGKVNETCNNCHAVTASIPVDVKHGLK